MAPRLQSTEKKELNCLDDLFVLVRTDATLCHRVRLFTPLRVQGVHELRSTHAPFCTDKVGMVTVFFRPYPISLLFPKMYVSAIKPHAKTYFGLKLLLHQPA
jgi:hypothetical protein